jgi:hypothetical protein
MLLLKVLFLLPVFLLLSTRQVFAVDTPNFPACSNPQGTLIASYDSGTHGVVGGTSHTGNDKVYRVDQNSLIQCLCTSDGKGVQTNWWRASSLDGDQIKILENEGWIYVPNGTVWGLEDSAYMARNISYSCLSDGGTGGGSGSSSSSSSIGQVLGLAFTGNIKLIYTVFALGIVSLLYGQILHRARN